MTPNEELLRRVDRSILELERKSTQAVQIGKPVTLNWSDADEIVCELRELRARLEKETRTAEKKGQP